MSGKIAVLAIISLIFLASLIAGLKAIEIAEANFVPGPPSIFIASPANKTYNTQPIYLNLTMMTFFDHGNGSRIVEYSLDGQKNVTTPTVYEGYDEDHFSTVTASAILPTLPEGSHSITVYATYHFPNYGNYTTEKSATSFFTINYASPYISILTPKTQEYNTTDIPITFTIDKPVSTINYKLDGKANVPINGNTTLIGLSEGTHIIAIYANDVFGTEGVSETIRFYINTEHSQLPTSTPLITLTPSSFPNTTTSPSIVPSPTSNASTPIPTSSPTSQSTLHPTFKPKIADVSRDSNDLLPYFVGISLIVIGAAGLLGYFRKRIR